MADNELPEVPEGEGSDSERETSLNPPTESLINETRGTSVRFSGAPPRPPSGAALIAVIAAVLIGLGLGVMIMSLGQSSEIDEARAAAELQLKAAGSCVEREGRCLGELGSCVRDLDGLIGPETPTGLAPRDFRVEKERKRRDAAEEERAAGREAVLGWVEEAGGRTGKAVADLKKLVKEFRALDAAYERIDKEYKAALAETAAPRGGAPDPELRERNERRSSYLAEARAAR